MYPCDVSLEYVHPWSVAGPRVGHRTMHAPHAPPQNVDAYLGTRCIYTIQSNSINNCTQIYYNMY